jgi:hypothetical protein
MNNTGTMCNHHQQRCLKLWLSALICCVLVAFDQLVKWHIRSSFAVGEVQPGIAGVFEFCYVQNRGAAFGAAQGAQVIFCIFAVVIVGFCIRVLVRSSRLALLEHACILAICAGALGNAIDRVALGYVVDFINLRFMTFPVFNLADIYITCAALVVMVMLLVCPSRVYALISCGSRTSTNSKE